MAEYVTQLRGTGIPSALSELVSFYQDVGTAVGGIRSTEYIEAYAAAQELAGLRDMIGAAVDVRFHVCRHDEGTGDCSGTVEAL